MRPRVWAALVLGGVPRDIKADLVTVSVCTAGFGYALWPKEFPAPQTREQHGLGKTNPPVKECPLLAGRCVRTAMKFMKYGQLKISYFYMALSQSI